MFKVIFLFFAATLVDVTQSKKRVCIIGAGMSGLAATKLSSDWPNDFETITFEKNSDVGGLWIYTDSTDIDEHGLPVHSSIYKYLRTNVPKEIMAYPDYLEFEGRENRSHVSHEYVLEYLRNYTEHFNLRNYIRLNTLVERVTRIDDGSDWTKSKWNIETRDLNKYKRRRTICDAVMVCNGHYFKPNIPKIPGIESFPGQVLHSHIYRHPEEFKDKTVVILGASVSGSDIGVELSSYAKTVYLSHRNAKIAKNFPENLIQVRGVVAANGSEFTLQDGSKITADSFIYCTGYLYEFPFFDESSGIFFENKKHVRPLYKYVVNVEHPSMALIGLPNLFSNVYYYPQIKFFLNLLLNKIKLPSYETMLEDSKRPPPKAPRLIANETYDPEWDYNADLAKEGDFEPLPAFYEKSMRLLVNLWLNEKDLDVKEYDLKFLENGNPILVHR